MWESSVCSDLRNLRRAGVLKKRSLMVMVGTNGEACVFNAEDVAAGDFDEGAGGFFGDAGLELEAGDAGDGREGLTAEAKGGDGEELVGGAEFGGGVALEGEEGVVLDHAVAVVGDADELAATGFDLDADAGGCGVEGVFEELFDDGGGGVRRLRRRRSGSPRGRRGYGCGPWIDCTAIGKAGSAVVHLAVTNLAVWWSESGKMVHTSEEVFQRQVEIGLDLAGFLHGVCWASKCIGRAHHKP